MIVAPGLAKGRSDVTFKDGVRIQAVSSRNVRGSPKTGDL